MSGGEKEGDLLTDTSTMKPGGRVGIDILLGEKAGQFTDTGTMKPGGRVGIDNYKGG